MSAKYKTGMVFGIYDKIEDRHAKLLLKANSLCDKLYVAVSSDKEVFAVTKTPSRVPLEERMRIVREFCRENNISAQVVGYADTSPADLAVRFCTHAYILSENQYKRFGKELEDIITRVNPRAKIEKV